MMTAFSGCTVEDDVFEVSFFTVSGNIYDATAEIPDSPVAGVTVTITGFSVEDIERTTPLYSDKCVSATDGSYQFSINSSDNLSGFCFVFTVRDDASYRTKHFQQTERELFLNPTSSFYNSFMKSFEVKDNDFYLSPEP